MSEPAARPRTCIVGPMLGRHPGWPEGPGETLARLLRHDGYAVRTTSSFRHGAPRLVDMLRTLVAHRHEIDVVVLMLYSGRAFLLADVVSRTVHRLVRRPLIGWLHGGALPAFAHRHPRWSARVLGRAAELVAPSPYLGDAFATLGPPLEVIPNVLELEAYPFHERPRPRPALLWMRTFHELYRPELALETLVRLRRDHDDATLTMAGHDAGLLAATRERARALGLDEAVRFPGFLDPVAKTEAFARHDVFLNTNRVDNMPVSVLEAAACGLPVVSTDAGGLRHLLTDGESALLVGGANPAADLATAVARLVADPALAARLSRTGRRLAESCAWPAVAPRWQALLARYAPPRGPAS